MTRSPSDTSAASADFEFGATRKAGAPNDLRRKSRTFTISALSTGLNPLFVAWAEGFRIKPGVSARRGRRFVERRPKDWPPAWGEWVALDENYTSYAFSARIWFMSRAGSAQPASPTIRAGTPATVLLCGTGASTTDPAATRAQ